MEKKIIAQNINNVLRETNLSALGPKRTGKVRDIYDLGDKLILISTDRHSSFDRIIAHIPFKGQILTETSRYWFDATKDIIPNHVLEYPDPNVLVAKKYKIVPIEIIPRAYITGSTNTSLWTHYQKGKRDFGNFILPEGLRKNEKLKETVLTFTTKLEEHDRSLTPKEIVDEGLLTTDILKKVSDTSLALFKRGQEISADRGFIMVDTKYEFGLDENNNLVLIDEIHTPDSARWWMLKSYEERFNNGEEPEYFDKEFLRLWFKGKCDPYKDKVLPEVPPDMIVELASRYIEIYEKMLGRKFEANIQEPIEQRIKNSLKKYEIQR
ncbi:MAG: phosphoribosylaminoimidazolesuccinocarboxamide synthase [Candidatus Doudnabacteria bacterium RIFCSPLOWO2_02_FULL_49_13]|uniref:Phosphoribosylaminoimidazole-succinocarboxamide synthase n=1 Tax=Candidatus Doudnabacteria bacterium RIFCSPHIGHO2_12_FULL_48_16 TaxID=1817838 RepID=A0A1F5PJN2_9BACT|nr:MAG: phosphoribosylaminoimidazolesuccinocarboxamide synthase [Candidatus Doudnabacteria bacterium RIFCSPHIGHO2_01_FULL_50_67]OGE90136.1 MAG: phosphoribosylaminoimidazolesuccinocarboxamide synthase [Candidatus Doudnabacteria bacterium RIFCSPHIGHO2_12_FULL_48_16]OGF03279.1 MAG: phosphoribosylaminoimidazolesuccinocarboxamide synthase [Candidatus Doudnabacteria bacterium RIFCSPLOWO2_02_FULL_49_13]OGF03825.1 MAG: phosphoribosylaminoimidazolesuccinocarboxamide synthase [Candidatus Doudnabacteria ba